MWSPQNVFDNSTASPLLGWSCIQAHIRKDTSEEEWVQLASGMAAYLDGRKESDTARLQRQTDIISEIQRFSENLI